MPPRSKLTPEVKQILEEALAAGLTKKLSAQLAGIGESTLHQWLREADQDDEKAALAQSLKKAEAVSAAHSLAVINQAAQEGSWQAAAWKLERRHGYRKDEPVNRELQLEAAEEEAIDLSTPEGRAAVLETLEALPQELILDALNRKSVGG